MLTNVIRKHTQTYPNEVGFACCFLLSVEQVIFAKNLVFSMGFPLRGAQPLAVRVLYRPPKALGEIQGLFP